MSNAFDHRAAGRKAGRRGSLWRAAAALGGAAAIVFSMLVAASASAAATAQLTLVNVVQHGATGDSTPATAWTLTASGISTISGASGDLSVTGAAVEPGTYGLSETGPTGFDASDWVCTGTGLQVDGTHIAVADGQNATCTITNTAQQPHLTLAEVVVNGTSGTAVPSDFTLTASNGTTTVTGPGNSAAVTNQPVTIGTYNLSETGPTGYTASDWSCAGGTPGTNTVTLALGGDATCTITSTAIPVPWSLSLSSNPASGSTVQPGDTITYTMTVTDLSGAAVSGAIVQADLANVLNNATLGTIGAGGSVTGTTLTWAVPDVAAGGTATLSYTVSVNPGAFGVALTASSTAETPGGSCATAADCTATVFTPKWGLSKASDPVSGGTVAPGDTITYTLTATNVGPVAVTDGVAQDDLSAVTPYATLDETDLAAEGLSYSSSTHLLTWTVPTIPVGGSVSVSYTVTVDSGVGAVAITNVASPTVPDGACANASDCTTTHPVAALAVPNVQISMNSSTTSVAAGKSFRYDILVENVSPTGAAHSVILSDPIPSTLKVTAITTATTGSPLWQNCAVTGRDANGFGGTLSCELSGDLGAAASAPPLGLDVTVASTMSADSVSNTATTCWLDPAAPAAQQQCAVSTVVVAVTHGKELPPTGGSATQLAWLAFMALAGGLLVVTGAFWMRWSRRRTAS